MFVLNKVNSLIFLILTNKTISEIPDPSESIFCDHMN